MEINNFQCVNKNIKITKFSSKHACGSPKALTAMKKSSSNMDRKKSPMA